ncbi:LysR family transcriptional regulator [Dechloromonas denitrificans]|uniref:LysR family transcriptional regulator n=1 Tax=Dechloromonas denitrificans TaxID=281362 RepID=UPI001CF812D1|nr:LysR family transcriptional regulator [Dechloromonas denitrificans]UCV01807.1 LysR family transcriptional regulator [Dechloromonas denitrificans]UCV06157.1 LysR family transcriptional regulator [Dechloromonas denitrificans]
MADRRLQVFHAVAKNLSFTRAADALFMTQPAVTFQIKQLEEQYGTRLFERRHGSISLTPAGELVLSYAQRILALSDEMETRLGEMTGEMRGPLLVGASTTIAEFMLPRILGEFNALYPQVRARLIVANSESIEGRVAEHSLDVGLIEAPAKISGLHSQICCTDELQVICTPDYPLAGMSSVTPKALVDYEFISREPGSGTREITDAYFRAHQVAPENLKTQMELGSPEALKGVVSTGLGFAIVSRAVVDKEIRLGALVAISLKPPLKRSLYLVYPQDRFQSRLTATFIEFTQRKLKELAS